MKIIYTTHQFLPEYHNGTEQLTYHTAKEARRRGHQVTIFTGFPLKTDKPPRNGWHDRYAYDDLTVERFWHHHTIHPARENPMSAEYDNRFLADLFRRRLDQLKPDLVHCYHLQRLSGSFLDVCRERGIPVVFSATDFWTICPLVQLLLPNGELCTGPDARAANCLGHIASILPSRIASKAAALAPRSLLPALMALAVRYRGHRQAQLVAIRALSQRLACMRQRFRSVAMLLISNRHTGYLLETNGIQACEKEMIPFGIDHTVFRSGSSDDKLRQTPVVGFIGTLIAHKGAHVLLQAVKLLASELPIQIRIYGDLKQDPHYTSRLRRLAGGDRRIRFCGGFPGHRIGEVLRELDALVVPSIWYENTPLTIHFAQLAGIPVIASDLGGIKEIVQDNINGCLFEKGNHRQLAAILSKLAADGHTRRRLALNARPPLSIPEYVNKLDHVYTRVVRTYRAKPY